MSSIRIDIDGKLADRLREVCNQLNVSAEIFACYALEQEITRQEIRFIKDEITIQEINRNILSIGQSLQVSLVEENKALLRHLHTCQMCMKEFERPTAGVDGPLFCTDCLGLAHGGDFSLLEGDV